MIHPCLTDKRDCTKCPLKNMEADRLCERMLATIKRVSASMLNDFDNEERYIIISDTIEGVKASADKYAEKRIEKVEHYVTKILANKRADYFRKISKKISNFKRQDIKNLDLLLEHIRANNIQAAYIYEDWLNKDTRYFINNYITLDNSDLEIKSLTDCLIRDFNTVLDETGFYKSEIFEIDIPIDILVIIKKENKTKLNTRKINKWLLTSIYPSLSDDWAGTITEVPFDDSHDNIAIEPLIENQITTDQILSKLKCLVTEDDDFCARLFLYWYSGLKQGLNQDEMAKNLGLKPNTFNQKLKRCKKTIQQHFQE